MLPYYEDDKTKINNFEDFNNFLYNKYKKSNELYENLLDGYTSGRGIITCYDTIRVSYNRSCQIVTATLNYIFERI